MRRRAWSDDGYRQLLRFTWPDTDVRPPLARPSSGLRACLECGILARGFAGAYRDACGHDLLVAFSCKGRGICPPSCTRRMVEIAAHLVEHVFPRLPVRQWVVTFPKRLRFVLHRDPVLLGAVRRFSGNPGVNASVLLVGWSLRRQRS